MHLASDSADGAMADLRAMSEQVLDHIDSLYGAAMRLTRADDLVQDTYVKAGRFEEQFKPGTHLKAWLHTILHVAAGTVMSRIFRGRRMLYRHLTE